MNDMSKYHTNNLHKLFSLFGEGESLALDVDKAIEYAATLPSSMQATFVGELLMATMEEIGYSPTVPTAILALKHLEEIEGTSPMFA